jgi:hypothetical protein
MAREQQCCRDLLHRIHYAHWLRISLPIVLDKPLVQMHREPSVQQTTVVRKTQEGVLPVHERKLGSLKN